MPRSGLALTIGFAAEAVREGSPLIHCVAPRAATSFVADVLHGAGARSVVTGTSPDAVAVGPRVNVRRVADWPWRFWDAASPTVSAHKRHPAA